MAIEYNNRPYPKDGILSRKRRKKIFSQSLVTGHNQYPEQYIHIPNKLTRTWRKNDAYVFLCFAQRTCSPQMSMHGGYWCSVFVAFSLSCIHFVLWSTHKCISPVYKRKLHSHCTVPAQWGYTITPMANGHMVSSQKYYYHTYTVHWCFVTVCDFFYFPKCCLSSLAVCHSPIIHIIIIIISIWPAPIFISHHFQVQVF